MMTLNPWACMPTLLVAGAAAFAPLAAAQIDGPESFVTCRFTGGGVAGSVSDIVGVNIAANVTAFLCNQTGVDVVVNNASVVAQEIATATATAIANTTGNCYARGRSRFTVNGLSLANAEAVAIASSVASASIGASVCGNCSIAAELFAESYSRIFLQATAMAELTLAGSVNGGEPVEQRGSNFVVEYVNMTATAYAEILATVRAGVDGMCNGTLLVEVGNERDGAECEVRVAALADEETFDAASELITDASATACNNTNSTVTLNATAEAIASAQAIAIAQITQTCTIIGESRVCSITSAQANATARAVASAFAVTFLNATSVCDPATCEVSTMVLTEAVDEVLSTATTSALVEQCGGPDDIFNITLLQSQIVEQSLTALSSIVFNVTAAGGECNIDLDIVAAILRGEVMVNNTRVLVTEMPMNMTIEMPMNTTNNTDMNMTVEMPMNMTIEMPMNTTDNTDMNMTVEIPMNMTTEMPVNTTDNMDMNTTVDTPMNMTMEMPMNTTDNTGMNTTVDTAMNMTDNTPTNATDGDGAAPDPMEPELPTCGTPCARNRGPCGGRGFPSGPVGCCSSEFACVESARSSLVVTCVPLDDIADGSIVCNPA